MKKGEENMKKPEIEKSTKNIKKYIADLKEFAVCLTEEYYDDFIFSANLEQTHDRLIDLIKKIENETEDIEKTYNVK